MSEFADGFYWVLLAEGGFPVIAKHRNGSWYLTGSPCNFETNEFHQIADRIYPPRTLGMSPERLAEYQRRPADGSMSEEEGHWYR